MSGKLEPVLRRDFLSLVIGRVWHATSVCNFQAIVTDGFIRAKPPVSRHRNSFCQSLGRVSLFDFRDAPSLSVAVERGDWWGFVGCPPDDLSVWLRVDHERLVVPTAAVLSSEWNSALQNGHFDEGTSSRIIEHLETGFPGDIPKSMLLEALLVSGRDLIRHRLIKIDGRAAGLARSFQADMRAMEPTDFASLLRTAGATTRGVED